MVAFYDGENVKIKQKIDGLYGRGAVKGQMFSGLHMDRYRDYHSETAYFQGKQ